jgi:4'-phosphopantetheinyl transferase
MLLEWTRKEAVLKAMGIGLALDPRKVIVSEPDEPPAVRDLPSEYGLPGQFSLREIVLRPDVVGHIAIIGERPDLAIHAAAAWLVSEA